MISAEVVKGPGKLIPHVVKNWVERYEKDPKPAMVELLTMLFEVVRNCLNIYSFKGVLEICQFNANYRQWRNFEF